MKKVWLKVVIGLAAILLAIGAILLLSHFQSKNAVERYKDQLRAAGEKLSIDELLPPQVSPESNGAKLLLEAVPYFSYRGVLDSNGPLAMTMVAPGKAMIAWRQTEFVTNYHGRTITNSWKDFEANLKAIDPGLKLIRQTAAYPHLDFGVDYHNPNPLAQSTHMTRSASLLSVSAVYALNHGDTTDAVTNVHAALSLINAWKNERLVYSQHIRFAMERISVASQWEVLQATNLTDTELLMMQHDWEAMDFIRPGEQAMEMQRAGLTSTFQDLRTSNSPNSFLGSVPSSSGGGLKGAVNDIKLKSADALWKASWSYSDELSVLQSDEVRVETLRDIESNGVFSGAMKRSDMKAQALGLDKPSTNWMRQNPNYRLSGFFLSFSRGVTELLQAESARKLTIAAIALKRYELRRGQWPIDLNALLPDFLSQIPTDPMDGKPLRYRPLTNGTFLLYSIGLDGKDDGGDAATTNSPSTSNASSWQRGRDWVWPQPATKEEITNYYKNLPK